MTNDNPLNTSPAQREQRAVLPIIAAYVALATVWLFLSNLTSRYFRWESLNFVIDAIFIITTAAILFRLIKECLSKRQLMEEVLQKSEELYRGVVEDQTEVICRFLRDGTLTFVNDVYCRLFGKSREELLWSSWQPMAIAEDIPEIEQRLKTMSPHNPVAVVENRVITGSGAVRWMQFVNRGVYGADGELVETQAVGRDITRLKEIEELLRRSIRRLNEQEETLRHSLAAELHDEIGRDLTAIGLNFRLLSDQLPPASQELLADHIEDINALIEGVSRTVRTIMTELRPPLLDDYGLSATLRWKGEQFAQMNGIEVRAEIDDDLPRLSREEETALFRIAQEALANVKKHATATSVTITLGREGDTVRLSIVDDGKGLAPADAELHPEQGSTFGLQLMRERADAVGGRLVLESSAGRGTMVTVALPLERP